MKFVKRWLRNLFWLPRYLYLQVQIYFLRKDVERLQAEKVELQRRLEEKKP